MSSESPTPFRTVLRGYEPAQVDQHIRELTTSLTALQQQSEQLQRHVQELQTRTDAAESAVVSAQENFRLAQGRFDAGVGTILELTDAQLFLTQAQNTEAQALADYRIAVARLERAIGRR